MNVVKILQDEDVYEILKNSGIKDWKAHAKAEQRGAPAIVTGYADIDTFFHNVSHAKAVQKIQRHPHYDELGKFVKLSGLDDLPRKIGMDLSITMQTKQASIEVYSAINGHSLHKHRYGRYSDSSTGLEWASRTC